ncbi:MAG: NAD(P)/FAD-dependent oxidoreductase [Candidatus Marinimicrobia bacterium]|nr:NAD(P)/FAD-dependent oxidoreductase [Candidatus Neomarinimicrobiota bacterium]MCF7850976.1 NAD(P)/FAD-dependent oxidoreductase [Candidatus Neomarinimicrobiota bacterium]MCF7905553.1 NAD(P)/FAD-dependent oxidoreductase [Candidatus Neomarinimicrobiota bacterium]
MSDYDVIVVGGGPAGSTAAYEAASRGAKTIILEKDRDIGYPVRCGEAVSDAGLRQFLEPQPEWIAAHINKISMRSPDNTQIAFRSDAVGYVLHRRIFDYALANRASQVGAEVQTRAYVDGLIMEDDSVKGVEYQYMGEKRKLTAKLVIAADGVESRVGRMAGMRTATKLKDMESAYQATVGNIDVDQELIDFYIGTNWAPGGYLWVFPKGNGMANVGLGVLGSLAKNYPSAHDLVHSFLKEHYPDATMLTSVCGGVPIAHTLKHITGNGIMLTGDAARMVHPVSGGGIISGMVGGQIAGQVAVESVNAGDVSRKGLESYPKRWRKAEGKTHEAIHRISETIKTITDDELDAIAHKLKSVPEEDRSILKVFTTVAVKKPKILLDVTRVFTGF